jgi:hypothetical protein
MEEIQLLSKVLSLQNTERLATLTKPQEFTTQKACIHCDSFGKESVTEYTFYMYLCSAIKKVINIMSWQTSVVMHISWTQVHP